MKDIINISQEQWDWLIPQMNDKDELSFVVADDRVYAIIESNNKRRKIIKLPRKVIPFPTERKRKTLKDKLVDILEKVIFEF